MKDYMEQRKTTSHTELKHWANEHGAQPALSMILNGEQKKLESRLVFIFSDTISESSALRFMDWEEFLTIFDEQCLCFVYDDHEAKSDYYRFEKQETADRRLKIPKNYSERWSNRSTELLYK